MTTFDKYDNRIDALVKMYEEDEIRYRAKGWFDLADMCRESIHQLETGQYCSNLTTFNGYMR
jgi:hypothetical protein